MALRRQIPLAVALVLAALAATSAGPSAAGAVTSCDRFASPTGSDSGAGTLSSPYRTPAKLVSSLASGETGCLRAGTYASSGDLSIRTAGITVASYPGELATLEGRLRVERTATGAVVEGLRLNVRNASNYSGLQIYADGAVLRDNEITNGRAPAVCILLSTFYSEPPPTGVVIESNRIHDCGVTGTNQRHGIYVAQARDTVIRDNWIHDNADRGIQLYPNADGTMVTGNVIDSNGQGVIISSSSKNNVIEHNAITNSTIRHNVESSSLTGTGNVVRENCAWTDRSSYRGSPDGSGIESTSSFSAYSNVAADPLYVDAGAADYRLRADSPCASVLGDSPPEDSTPPETTITSGPTGTITATSASFSFTSSESGSTFECRLDAGAWTGCASPVSHSGLSDGEHTFDVRATDPAGNTDPSPASRAFTVDPPSSGLIPSGNLTTNPSFESSTSGWDSYRGSLTRVSDPLAPDGSYVTRVSWTGNGSTYTIDDSPSTVRSSRSGATYTARAYAREATESGGEAWIKIREWRRGRVVGQAAAKASLSADGYVPIEVSYTATRSGNGIDVMIHRGNASPAFYVDAITLTQG